LKRGYFVLVWIIMFLIFLIGSVSAIDSCCEFTNDGDWCVYTDQDNCDSRYSSTSTSCEQTSYCAVGTCYSSDTGSCYENTPRSTCEAEEGTTWTDIDADDLAQCQKGCCSIADQAFFVTEVKCKSVGSQYADASVGFDSSIETEYACLESVKNKNLGCCVTDEEYTFETREECNADEEEVGTNFTSTGFHEGMLCSNDLLSSDCAKQHHTGCFEGKVYWYDSCGNRENIYSSDERTSYNSGYILEEIDSCEADGPYDENCGNCDYANGMICGDDEDSVMAVGDYTCVDLNCYETYENDASPLSGDDKLNGESWCVFDTRPGEGLDTVGSRHYRHICINGEEVVENCADFREEICISGVLNEDVLGTMEALGLSSENNYVEAACRDNRADTCTSCNSEDLSWVQKVDCCANEDLRDCHWLTGGDSYVEEGVSVSNGTCVPQVPPGLQFWSEDGAEESASSSEVCSQASSECKVSYRIGGWKKVFGGKTKVENWELIEEAPDGCASKDWLINQNVLCRSLGDCGAYYNFVGEAGLDGLSTNIYDEEFFFEVEELEASDLGDMDYLMNVNELDEGKFWGFNSPQILKNPATYIAAATFLIGGVSGLSACDNAEKANEAVDEAESSYKDATRDDDDDDDAKEKEKEKEKAPAYSTGEDGGSALDSASGVLSKGRSVTSSFQGLSGFSDGAECFVGSAVPLLGLFKKNKIDYSEEDKSKFESLNIDEITQYASLASKYAGKAKAAGTVSKVANVATVVAIAYIAVEYGFDNETTMTYSLDCNMWQAPKGGENCELCNSGDTPCSEYKCRALGASCDLVNVGTTNESCVSQFVNDVNSPIISVQESLFGDEYTLRTGEEEGNKGFEINEKIPAFTNVQLGLSTDEPAQCKYSTDPSTEFENMNSFFGSDLYLYNHSLMFSLGDEVTDEEIMALTEGIYTFYVRCSDANANANERDYYIRFTVDDTPDLTPPEIAFSSIDSGSYMPYDLEETTFSIYTNEPANCLWNNNDTSYEFMNGEMDCANSGFQQSSEYFGTYECSTTLTGVGENEINRYYFRCMDNSGNINDDSYEFITKQTEDPLEIVEVGPEGTVGQDISLEIETDNGADNGEATCKFYSEDVPYDSMIEFVDTNGSDHSQILEMAEGSYNYYFACMDVAGNFAYNSTSFTVEVDNNGPLIEIIYVDTAYSVLYIEMDEESTCEYASESFTYGEGSLMTGEEKTGHEASLESLYYYIICQDIIGNQGSYEIDLSAWV
jgi:hypothetical protein